MAKREYTKARKEANERWNEQHKAERRYYNSKSTCKRFIRVLADHNDLLELKKMIEDRFEDME